MNLKNSLLAVTLIATSLGIPLAAKADTVQARCDVYPKGEDRAISSDVCTFSQRQGAVGIELKDGTRYNLRPVGNKPGNYEDDQGRAAYRQSGLGDLGQIYRLADVSVYVYWDNTPYGNSQSGDTNSNSSAATSHPDAGSEVASLSSLVGAKAGQAENMVKEKGYRFVKSSGSGDSIYSYWLESPTNYCVTIRTEDGRYQSIVYATPLDCQ